MSKFIILFITLIPICSFAQNTNVQFEETTSFYPNEESLKKHEIEWGVFTVPEDWDNINSNTVKLAIAILKNTSKSISNNPVIIVDGGPGAGSIEGIGWWLNHPLRKKSDIILMDARGTGFSEPRLCPDLGKKFLNILAKNQHAVQDDEEKVLETIKCKQELVAKGIDPDAYHSKNMAKDLHALKEYLEYPNWNVYGISYGTYVAQVYANDFPNDAKTLILDSPISNIEEYYVYNTSNYISSINKVFEDCKNDPDCNSAYPNLEDTYYNVIESLTKEPITVKVDTSIIEEGTFTYNVEDFKVAIHQSLYQKRLIEILPLLVYQFHNRNEDALSALVVAFSGALGLDYGLYYCVTCNEAIPNNSIEDYKNDLKKHPKLKGGVSFYGSDFSVCNKWNNTKNKTVYVDSLASRINAPSLIFTGKFDPITPARNGDSLAIHIKNAHLVKTASLGHASSLSREGFKIVNTFINIDAAEIQENNKKASKVSFIKDVYVNGGISKLGNSLNNFDLLFFTPLVIALLISLVAIFAYLIELFRKKQKSTADKLVRILLIISSILGVGILIGFILAINDAASINFYILAFGISTNWGYLFPLFYVFIGVLLLSMLYFVFCVKKIDNRSVVFTVLFSNILIGSYFMYWGFL
ncbi:TAP-like protein [Aquimarina sp. MAR_2010_214]|uniref:alpha/beta fold hydrolase n=1 Tax=Aquimarina sp. MAR_2010_214 TaxID=1250026 RepID=UPI000C6FE428|nr:alpha/beta fold hydrolase [Aquimarina sp. MAR_2010_214]PKV49535.1 TAP-like protein [Aquimarina sp. MAR_2010_214]